MHAESAHTCLRTAAVAGVLTAALAALSVQAKTPRQMFETMPPELHPNSDGAAGQHLAQYRALQSG